MMMMMMMTTMSIFIQRLDAAALITIQSTFAHCHGQVLAITAFCGFLPVFKTWDIYIYISKGIINNNTNSIL